MSFMTDIEKLSHVSTATFSFQLTNYPLKTEWNSEDCTEVIAVFDNRELGNLFQNIEILTLNVLAIIESIAFK